MRGSISGQMSLLAAHGGLSRRAASPRLLLGLFGILALLQITFLLLRLGIRPGQNISERVLGQRQELLDRCKYIRTPAGPPRSFRSRTISDRFVNGTKPTLIRNAKIWTGGRSGTEVIYGDILLDKGLVKAFGYIPQRLLERDDLRVYDAQSAWVTPGLVDLHSHIGVSSSPSLRGASDTNSRKAPILPWLRSIDGLNTHDDAYALAISGGVTTAQILPGSANNIGGQAFVIKLRPTDERSPTSMVVEPPYTLNGTNFDHTLTPRWRHMKHACGENPSRVYAQTRMDSGWNFRHAYDEARKIKETQDEFCAKAAAGLWDDLDAFPESLQWEALVDVLRGKLSVHCYEAVDLDGIVRLSNEYQFPVASFHHAGETYLVPDLLKRTWGGAPTIALFASNFRKKREAYRGSEFAPRILAGQGIPVVMKSDHPVLNSRYLLFEAAQAHYYGLDTAHALASVTSVPARAAGLDHRIGFVREGYDADIVIWDSHPLTLGATPKQVFVDGIPQLSNPFVSQKPLSFQDVPETPDFDEEARAAVQWEGLPPLEPKRRNGDVVFVRVRSIYVKKREGRQLDVAEMVREEDPLLWRSVRVRGGKIVCIAPGAACVPSAITSAGPDDVPEVVDLQGGALAPGLTSFGAPLGLVEIHLEPSTNDGDVVDAFSGAGGEGGYEMLVRAVDGLSFGGRNVLLAYRSGVTRAISAPTAHPSAFLLGVSTAFSTGALHALERGSVSAREVALHVRVGARGPGGPSVGSQVGALRKLLFGQDKEDTAEDTAWSRVRAGIIPLVVHAESADTIATVLSLKAEFDAYHALSIPHETRAHELRLTIAGGAEAHLLAPELSAAGVSVVLLPVRPFPGTWAQRRILPGPPLTRESALVTLLNAGVHVSVGVVGEHAARNARFDVGWAALEANGTLTERTALALASTNLERALGLDLDDASPSPPSASGEDTDAHAGSLGSGDLVAYAGGGALDMRSTPVGVVSPARGVVELF